MADLCSSQLISSPENNGSASVQICSQSRTIVEFVLVQEQVPVIMLRFEMKLWGQIWYICPQTFDRCKKSETGV